MIVRLNVQFINPGKWVGGAPSPKYTLGAPKGAPKSYPPRRWVEDPSYWTYEKKQDDMLLIQQGIELTWNFSGILIYAGKKTYTKQSYTLGPSRPRVSRCPGPYRPDLTIVIGENLSGADFNVYVHAMSLRAYRRGNDMHLSDDDKDGDLYADWRFGYGAFYTTAHEFGHLLGLDHPGVHFYTLPWNRNDASAYDEDPRAVMGCGSEMRPQYFERWDEQLDIEYPKFAPWYASSSGGG
jgi:hypothetical protein